MATYYVKRALEVLQEEGAVEFSRRFKNFLYQRLCRVMRIPYLNLYYKPMMKVKYGPIRPLPREILIIDPTLVDYRIIGRYLPDNRPPFEIYGIIGGDWDLKKTHWKDEGAYHTIDSRVFYGLIERFEQGKEWEDTVYYQTGVEFLESGEPFMPLSYSQTKPDFRRYLRHLDNLYKDIKENGYDMSSIITVSIGRDGEFIVQQGQHRLTIARIAGVEEVPVRIRYRHKQWQELRHVIHNNGLPEDRENLLDHPDLQDVLD